MSQIPNAPSEHVKDWYPCASPVFRSLLALIVGTLPVTFTYILKEPVDAVLSASGYPVGSKPHGCVLTSMGLVYGTVTVDPETVIEVYFYNGLLMLLVSVNFSTFLSAPSPCPSRPTHNP